MLQYKRGGRLSEAPGLCVDGRPSRTPRAASHVSVTGVHLADEDLNKVAMPTKRCSVAVVAITGLLAACATAPTGPTVMVLPASGKTLEQFHTDDLTCQQLAAHEIAGSSSREITRQRRFDIAYMQCMYANGRQIPIPGGQPSYTSAPGAGTPTTAPVVPSVGVPTAPTTPSHA